MKLTQLTATDKQNLIKKVELDIAEYEEERKKIEKSISTYRSAYWLAAIGFFAGLFLLVLGLWYCSAILIPAGALAVITQTIQIRKLNDQIIIYDSRIKTARSNIRELL